MKVLIARELTPAKLKELNAKFPVRFTMVGDVLVLSFNYRNPTLSKYFPGTTVKFRIARKYQESNHGKS